ncbi:hypothetical protein HJFPF1_12441 [Paramyrothecium foliicola]|nr:hypothetical protein HJFPF1_12441 [Paramyrothecium foliicola]
MYTRAHIFIGSIFIAQALADTSPWLRTLQPNLIARAGKEYVRKQGTDPYCPEEWMKEYLSDRNKQFSAPWEVFKPSDPEDGLVCDYAISSENKAMVMTDVDGSNEEEIDSCYRDGLFGNIKHKLGARNAKTIIAADLVNSSLRKAVEAGIKAAGKIPDANNAVTIKPGDKAWVDFIKNNAVVTGILNTLCTSKQEMGNPKIRNFVAVSRKAKPGKPDLHIVANLV